MAPPRRRAAAGTVAAICEDLVFARDAGGVLRAGPDRLNSTIALLGHAEPTDALDDARELIRACTQRVCATVEQTQNQDPCTTAAALSVRAILLQPLKESVSASTVRRQALHDAGCYMQPDSLRKREITVLNAIAALVHREVMKRGPEDLPAPEALLERMAPIADTLSDALQGAVEFLVLRDELDDDAVQRALDYTYWSLGELLIWPRATFDSLRALTERPIEYWVLEQECLSILILPFQAEPADAVILMDACLEADGHEGFARSFALNPATADAARRLVAWLESCTPRCQFHRSTTLAAMCPPHQYVVLLDDFVDAVKHLRTGEYGREVHRLLGPAFAERQT